MLLRPYQEEAKAAVYRHLRERDDNPCVVIPTAGGKTPLLASICQDAVTLWQGRVLILAHVKELLEQAVDKLNAVCPEVRCGVYSAGLGRRDTQHPVIVAGIQSVYKRACELEAFDLIVIDEAHLIPLEGDGMYRQFLADARVVNPQVRIVGLTATPFRLKTGPICTPDGFLNHVCFEVGVRQLIRDGYLCPLVSRAGQTRADTAGLHVRAGEFVSDELEDLMDREELVRAACAEIVDASQDRAAVLIFASGVRHGEHVAEVLEHDHGIACGFLSGETPTDERKALIEGFRQGQRKYLCNVNVLTTGFDAPNVDCVVLLRPTLSPGLYYQMVGRGFRLHPGKQDCLVLDFGGNVLRHGPVDQLRVQEVNGQGDGHAPAKECPDCHALIAAGYGACPHCGHQFPEPQRRPHAAQASAVGVLAAKVTTTRYEVQDVRYSVHRKHGAEDAPRSMRVDYLVGGHGHKSEWICFEHSGYARAKAVQWWQRRSRERVPDTAQQAVQSGNNGGLALTTAITVRAVEGEPYERIIDHEVGPMPESLEDDEVPQGVSAWGDPPNDDEPPF
jgi:DNA repair protein RadD